MNPTTAGVGAAVVLSGFGVLQSGVGFLATAVDTPLWFILASVALPTGELLSALRGTIYRFTPAKQKKDR